MIRLRGLEAVDRLILIGYLAGTAGFALAWLPGALLYVAALSLALAFVHDRRTPTEDQK